MVFAGTVPAAGMERNAIDLNRYVNPGVTIRVCTASGSDWYFTFTANPTTHRNRIEGVSVQTDSETMHIRGNPATKHVDRKIRIGHRLGGSHGTTSEVESLWIGRKQIFSPVTV